MSQETPRISNIFETSLYVGDLDQARRFYQDLFGFEALLTDERMCALAVPGGQVLLLFRQGGSQQPSKTQVGDIPPHNATGQQHLCFMIPTEEVAAWEQRLAEFDIPIESRLVWPQNAISIYFRDLDNHSIELSTPNLWHKNAS